MKLNGVAKTYSVQNLKENLYVNNQTHTLPLFKCARILGRNKEENKTAQNFTVLHA
jgi:hypothetical protein